MAILSVAFLTSCSHRWHKKHQDQQKFESEMSFEDLRAWKHKYLANKMEHIKLEQACIDKATDKAGLKKCTDDVHEKWKESMKEEKKN